MKSQEKKIIEIAQKKKKTTKEKKRNPLV